MKTQSFAKQVPKNLAINILSFMATVVIGLWLTPYLLSHLGIVAYGLIPLAMFLSQYVSVIINAINMSINRFLLIALQKNKDKDANEIFNTSLVIITIFILLQSLVMALILYDINYFFSIPDELVSDAVWLFGLTFIGFSISLMRSVFGTSMFAYNRLDILRMIDIVQNLVRVVTIVALFVYDEPSLKYVGIANLLAAMSAIPPTLYYFKQYTPQIKVQISAFSKHRVSELSKMSMWILINQVGVLLLGNIDLYLVNKWIGAQATGEYAIILQFTIIFKTFLTLFSGILTPVIMIYYANTKMEKLKKFLFITTKLMVIVLILPLSLIIGLSDTIITLWLGEKYLYIHELISFSMLFFIVSIPVVVLYNITISYNKMKVPALLTLLLGLVSIVSIYVLITETSLALWGIVWVKLIIEVIFSLFMIFYVSHILSISSWKLFVPIVYSVLSFIGIIGIIFVIKASFLLYDWSTLILFCIGLCIIIYPSLFVIFLSKEERNMIFNKLIRERRTHV